MDEIVTLYESSGVVDFAAHVLTETLKAEMLDFLKTARDIALALYEAATGEVAPPATNPAAVPTADPVLLEELEVAQLAYDEALAKASADSSAALAGSHLRLERAIRPPPCDSEELRRTLEESLCTGAFVNPITPEEEAMTPGITAMLDAHVAEVCAAVEQVCLDEA